MCLETIEADGLGTAIKFSPLENSYSRPFLAYCSVLACVSVAFTILLCNILILIFDNCDYYIIIIILIRLGFRYITVALYCICEALHDICSYSLK